MAGPDTGFQWVEVDADEASANTLADEVGISLPLARMLVSRGIENAPDARSFLAPKLAQLADPYTLPDMQAAVDRCLAALDCDEHIVVFGDYDVDGVTSTALLHDVLSSFSSRVSSYIPHRVEEGYGLSLDALKRCIEECNPSLVMTVDCGTGSVEAVQYARTVGVDVIVTDHHQVSDDVAPAVAVVNPNRVKDHPLGNLAGVGVAFKFCHALLKQLKQMNDPRAESLDLKESLDLVALGTIADVVSLRGENRILVSHGLTELNTRKRVGLRELAGIAKIKGEIGAYQVGFQIGPRLNAAGRLGDARKALSLIQSQKINEAKKIALYLDQENSSRRQIEQDILDEICRDLDQQDPSTYYAIVVHGEGWHPGVIGIVASRLVQRYHRPAVVIAVDEDGVAKGSCRSIHHCNIVEMLQACREHLVAFGGHPAAAGLTINASAIKSFKESIEDLARSLLEGKDLRPELRMDGSVDIQELDERFIETMDAMQPFGMGNPTPNWCIKGVVIETEPRIVGNGHVKLVLAKGANRIEAMGFNMADREWPQGELDVAGQIKLDTYFRTPRIVLHIKDFRPSRSI